MPTDRTSTLTTRKTIVGITTVGSRIPVVQQTEFLYLVNIIVRQIITCNRIRGSTNTGGYRCTITVVRGSQILLHPALRANLHGAVPVAVKVYHLRGTAHKVGIIHIINIILQTVDQILQTVDLILKTGDIGNSGQVVQIVVVAREGHRGQAVVQVEVVDYIVQIVNYILQAVDLVVDNLHITQEHIVMHATDCEIISTGKIVSGGICER